MKRNPLRRGSSRKVVSANIRYLMHHPHELTAKGAKMKHRQAIAIALRKAGLSRNPSTDTYRKKILWYRGVPYSEAPFPKANRYVYRWTDHQTGVSGLWAVYTYSERDFTEVLRGWNGSEGPRWTFAKVNPGGRVKPCIVTIKRGRKVRYLRVRRNPDAPAGVAVTEVKAPTPTAPPVAPEKKTNPPGRFKKTHEYVTADGKHSFRAGRHLDNQTWDDRHYVLRDGKWKFIVDHGYDGHDSQTDAAASAKAARDHYDNYVAKKNPRRKKRRR